jgi:hypothetical protein
MRAGDGAAMIAHQKPFMRKQFQIAPDGDFGDSEDAAQLSHTHASTSGHQLGDHAPAVGYQMRAPSKGWGENLILCAHGHASLLPDRNHFLSN